MEDEANETTLSNSISCNTLSLVQYQPSEHLLDSPKGSKKIICDDSTCTTSVSSSVLQERQSEVLQEVSSLLGNTIEQHTSSQSILTQFQQEQIIGPETDTLCGLGHLRGRWLQKLACPSTYVLLSSVVALVQGTYFTYTNATLSTLEKRFHLPSKASGFITTGNDIVQLALSVHITFIAGRGHRPRWLAFGMILAAVGCFLAAVPHLIFGAGNLLAIINDDNSLQSDGAAGMLCTLSNNSNINVNKTNTSCEDDASVNTEIEQYTVVVCHLISQMLAGVASLLYYTIGYSYLDEAVPMDKVPLLLAFSGSVRLIGPILGYSLAGWCLDQWIIPGGKHSLSITPSHPRWIGAWWMGYVVIGSLLVTVSWWLVFLPRTLPGTWNRRRQQLVSAATSGTATFNAYKDTLRPPRSDGWTGLWPTICRIWSSSIFRLISLNQIFFWFAFFGYITFKSKYLEHQFRISAAKANQYIAAVLIAATLGGWLVTGVLLSCLRPKPRKVILGMACLSTLSCVSHVIQMSVSCNHGNILGLDTALGFSSVSSEGDCGSLCMCNNKYHPVCVDESLTYFNPCYAGCPSSITSNSTQLYEQCSCASTVGIEHMEIMKNNENNGYSSNSTDTITVGGMCPLTCSLSLTIYLGASVLAKMAQAASRVPVNIMLFRCVAERDKDVALGLFNAALALAASIPAPIIFGWIIDSACRLWESDCNNNRGFCWLYDLDLFRKTLHGIPAVLLLMCVVTDLLLLRHHKNIQLYQSQKETNFCWKFFHRKPQNEINSSNDDNNKYLNSRRSQTKHSTAMPHINGSTESHEDNDHHSKSKRV